VFVIHELELGSTGKTLAPLAKADSFITMEMITTPLDTSFKSVFFNGS